MQNGIILGFVSTFRSVGLKVSMLCTKNVFLAIGDSLPHKSPVADAFPGPQIKNFGWVGVFRPNGNYPRSCERKIQKKVMYKGPYFEELKIEERFFISDSALLVFYNIQ